MLVLPHDMKTQPTWSESSLKNQTKGMWGIIPFAIQTARFRKLLDAMWDILLELRLQELGVVDTTASANVPSLEFRALGDVGILRLAI